MAETEGRPPDLPNELKAAVRKEAVAQAAKWTVWAIVTLIALAATGWWLYLKPQLVEIVGGLPSGAVVAFDLPGGCPSGWTSFERSISRVIVGAAQANTSVVPNLDEKRRPLTPRTYNSTGGEENHVLTDKEMPSLQIDPKNDIQRGSGGYNGITGVTYSDFTKIDGQNNMSPFIALFYCRKI